MEVNLRDVLVNDFGLNLAAWSLQCATDVSADGLTIVGDAQDLSCYAEAWIAHIPEPTTLLLLMLGGLAVMRRKR